MNTEIASRDPQNVATTTKPAGRSVLRRFLLSPYAPLLTHFSLAALLAAEFALILSTPFWVAIAACVLIHHRIGILLHEYMHGIPFHRYRHNLWLFSAVNGLLITFGSLEVFRGCHLAHHRWLNTEKDPGFWKEQGGELKNVRLRVPQLVYRFLSGDHGLSLQLKRMFESFIGRHPYVKPRQVVIEAGLSLASVAFWFLMGLPRVPLILITLHFCIVPGSSFRGAMEHSSYPGDPNFANEYRVWIPLFNMNRHIHHHLDPTCPWYRLRFCTPNPLPPMGYWTHWYHLFVKRDYTFMKPMPSVGASAIPERCSHVHSAVVH